MNPDLEQLIQLQHAESELKALETRMSEAPKKKAELDAALAHERSLLDAARSGLAESQKSRKLHEGGLQDLEGKRSKYKGQLMEVKTNKEYTAVLHEIEAVERDIRAREDQILVEMEKTEALTADVKREEQHFKTVEERYRSEAKEIDAQSSEVAQGVERVRAERDRIAATIAPELLSLYQRIARLRGVAVAAARDGMCQQCHLTLRPQMYVDLKKNEQLVQCPACNRLLYYDAPVPVVDPPQP
jgi:predicted  nucleic acid-binding Zn-ribbon protein